MREPQSDLKAENVPRKDQLTFKVIVLNISMIKTKKEVIFTVVSFLILQYLYHITIMWITKINDL